MDEIPDSIHSVEQHLQQIKAFLEDLKSFRSFPF